MVVFKTELNKKVGRLGLAPLVLRASVSDRVFFSTPVVGSFRPPSYGEPDSTEYVFFFDIKIRTGRGRGAPLSPR